MEAVSQEANVPPIIALITKFDRSALRSGAIAHIPPNCIPIEPKFANPQRA